MLAGFGPVQVSRCGITRKRKANPMRGQESDGSGCSDDALGNQVGAKGPAPCSAPEGRGSRTVAGYGISFVSSFRAAAERISTDRTLARKEGAWQKTFI